MCGIAGAFGWNGWNGTGKTEGWKRKGENHGRQVCGLASLKRNFLPFFFRFFKAYYRLDGG
jgi:hypothetical protein